MRKHEKIHSTALKESYQARQVNPGRVRAIMEYAGSTILDVGCGSGAYVFALSSEFDIRGVDYEQFESWRISRELFSIASAFNLPFDDNSFETLLCFETLEHLVDPEMALRELHRVCSKNIILSVPNCVTSAAMKKSGLIFNHWIDRTHVNFWDMASVKQIVEESGFKVVSERLINEISIGYLVAEAIGCRGGLARLIAGFFNRFLQKKKYPMTCLLVAEKNAISDDCGSSQF
jgi:ubiquinone/menaquinone biosynthesis C-methylase UbiE